jgi:hypothetical protein
MLTLSACTFSLNTAGKGGDGGSCDTGHSADPGMGGNGGNGGGIFNCTNALLATLRSSLFAMNAAGTGGNSTPGRAGIAGSDPDVSGAFTSLGHNLVGITGNSMGLVNGVNGDLVGTVAAPIDALLGPLTNNGGATYTMALLPSSPAIDAGDDALTGTDQRGVVRKCGQHVDIGAYELDVAALGYSAPSLGSVSCSVSNLISGLALATFSFSVNPNGLNTFAWIDYGISSYGGTTATLALGCTNVMVSTNITMTGFAPGTTYHYCLNAYNPAGTTNGTDHTFTTSVSGDLNGDGAVSDSEFQTIRHSYWQTHPLTMTDLNDVGGGALQVALSNSASPGFIVLASTNLVDWEALSNGLSVYYQITDTNAANYPHRFYRLCTP